MSEADIESAKVKMRANGDMTIIEDGTTPTVIAHYNKKTEELQFESQAYSQKYYTQVISRIGTVANGTEVSSYHISKITIKGMESKLDKNAPPMPNPEEYPEGDAAKPVVEWLLKYDMKQAIARYGIFLGPDGEPIKKPVRRTVVYTVDKRNLDDSQIQENRQGKTSTKGPVSLEGELIEHDSAIIARRATALTFAPNEVVGGFRPIGYRAPVAVSTEENE